LYPKEGVSYGEIPRVRETPLLLKEMSGGRGLNAPRVTMFKGVFEDAEKTCYFGWRGELREY
jgi:hypothetical protein